MHRSRRQHYNPVFFGLPLEHPHLPRHPAPSPWPNPADRTVGEAGVVDVADLPPETRALWPHLDKHVSGNNDDSNDNSNNSENNNSTDKSDNSNNSNSGNSNNDNSNYSTSRTNSS